MTEDVKHTEREAFKRWLAVAYPGTDGPDWYAAKAMAKQAWQARARADDGVFADIEAAALRGNGPLARDHDADTLKAIGLLAALSRQPFTERRVSGVPVQFIGADRRKP